MTVGPGTGPVLISIKSFQFMANAMHFDGGQGEKYDIGNVDWAVIDASGAPEHALQRCQQAIATRPEFAAKSG